MASKAAKKKQNLEMYDALESTINRVTDQAQRFRRKMDELVSKLLLSLWDLSPQGHQELSGKSDKNNSLKPNQTTPLEHCHFQRLRAKPNFLRLSRTERDLNTRLNFDECALI